MSIMINLLPDLRQAKLRERRRRQMVSGISVMIWAVSGGIVILLSLYTAGQKVAIGVVTGNITKSEDSLRAISGLPDALTAQQHLASLPGLYAKRVYMTKFFNAYSQANPVNNTLNSLSVDSTNLLTVNGTAKTYADVAKLDRALTASNVSVGVDSKASNTPYFSNVNISSVTSDQKGVSYTITATVAPGATEVKLGK